MSNQIKKIMIEQIDFTSTLLVPLPEYAQGMSFRWIDTFRGTDGIAHNTVHVLVFNTANKDEIKTLLEKDLELLKQKETTKPTDNIRSQVNYIMQLLNDLERPGIRHDAPKEVLAALERASHRQMTKDRVIYLSGITSLRKK